MNGALVRAPDEETVLTETCRILVEAGGYRLAWVGFAEDDPSVRSARWPNQARGRTTSAAPG